MDPNVKQAKRAIDRVADNRQKDFQDVLYDLEELDAHLDGCMAGIRDDLKDREGS